MNSVIEKLRPDAELVRLQRDVNRRLGGYSTVNFYFIPDSEGEYLYGCVFTNGADRRAITSDELFHADDIVQRVRKWVEELRR